MLQQLWERIWPNTWQQAQRAQKTGPCGFSTAHGSCLSIDKLLYAHTLQLGIMIPVSKD